MVYASAGRSCAHSPIERPNRQDWFGRDAGSGFGQPFGEAGAGILPPILTAMRMNLAEGVVSNVDAMPTSRPEDVR